MITYVATVTRCSGRKDTYNAIDADFVSCKRTLEIDFWTYGNNVTKVELADASGNTLFVLDDESRKEVLA